MSNKEKKLKDQTKLKGRNNRPNPHGKKLVKGQHRRVRGPGRRHRH